jgi:hypothetical protein
MPIYLKTTVLAQITQDIGMFIGKEIWKLELPIPNMPAAFTIGRT